MSSTYPLSRHFNRDRYCRTLASLLECPLIIRNEIGDKNLSRAQWLVDKLVLHGSSALQLLNGTQLPTFQTSDEVIISDFSSVGVLLRSVLESYLTFFYIFIDYPPPSDEFLFRHSGWQLESLEFRQQTATTSTQYHDVDTIKILLNERKQIKQLKSIIKSTHVFQQLSDKQKTQVLNNQKWRSDGWKSIAKRAGFRSRFSDFFYSHLSLYAHSGTISGFQMEQTLPNKRKAIIESDLVIIEAIASKMIIDYINLFPVIDTLLKEKDSVAVIRAQTLSGAVEDQP